MPDPRNIGVVYNHRVSQAQELATAIVRRLELGEHAWLCPTDELEKVEASRPLSLVITVGGDGTILRAVRLAAPVGAPILGVNMGRLGFMTELRASEALEQVPRYLGGEMWVEERMMLQASVLPHGGEASRREAAPFHGLNDAVVGRSSLSRLVRLQATVDGVELATYKADAVIVATATGSTAYALSVGGPILYPQSRDLLLKAVAPHLDLAAALILPPAASVELTVMSDQPTMLSVDGYMDSALAQGDTVRITASPYRAHFLRANPPTYFFQTLTRRLGLRNNADRPKP